MTLPESVLVTGGAGFIGSHLCEALLDRGVRVICLDNFCDFYAPETKRNNIRLCQQQPGFILCEGDICDAGFVRQVLEQQRPELVIHLAALAGVRPSILDPANYVRVNIDGTANLLQLCAQQGIHNFIFASSSSVYGNNEHVPFAEADPVDHPISPYAATKKAGELLCHTWHHLHQISMLCLRFFTVYGPRQRPDLAIHKFAHLLSEGKPIPVYGDDSTSRDYTYIDDIIGGILSAAELVCSRHCYEVINLGTDHSISLNQMISTLEQVSGLQAQRDHLGMQEGDVLRTLADISRARQLLGYQPQTPFAEGINRFWQWFEQEQLSDL